MSRALDLLARWLLAFDPDANSPYWHRRAIHWFRTVIRFGLFYAAAFAVFYGIAWLVLPAAGIAG